MVRPVLTCHYYYFLLSCHFYCSMSVGNAQLTNIRTSRGLVGKMVYMLFCGCYLLETIVKPHMWGQKYFDHPLTEILSNITISCWNPAYILWKESWITLVLCFLHSIFTAQLWELGGLSLHYILVLLGWNAVTEFPLCKVHIQVVAKTLPWNAKCFSHHWVTLWSWECLTWIWLISLQPYFIAETTMPGKSGFDFNGASRSFNVLAEYLFGKVVICFRTEPDSCILNFTGLLLVTIPLWEKGEVTDACCYYCGRIQRRRKWRWLHLLLQVRINLMGLKWIWQLLW